MRKGIFKILLLTMGLLFASFSSATEATDSVKKAEPRISASQMASVRQVVKSKIIEVQRCYTDLIIEGMAKSGKVVVEWDIDDKGAVQNLNLKENTSDSGAVAGCVTEKLQYWTFPPAPEGNTYSVSYPFQLGN